MFTTGTSRTTIKLSNGVEMPVVALGTAPLSTSHDDTSHFHPLNSFNGFLPEQAYRSVHVAVLEMNSNTNNDNDKNKKKNNDDDDDDDDDTKDDTKDDAPSSIPVQVHIDTALYYRTHPHIRHVLGTAFATGQKKRSDIFLTTKICHPNFDDQFGTEDLHHCLPLDSTYSCELNTYDEMYSFAYRQFQQSLHECGIGYFDLVLLHWPARNAQHRLAMWNVLEDCYQKGWTRAIGVSNFNEHHLEELQTMNEAMKRKRKNINDTNNTKGAVAVRPHVNQIEASVFLQHRNILNYCQSQGIVTAAYSPLGRGVTQVTTNEIVQRIAAKYPGKDSGQIAMKYLLQKGYGCVVFWTTNVERIHSNHQLHDFQLDKTDMVELDALNRLDGSGTWGLLSPYEIP